MSMYCVACVLALLTSAAMPVSAHVPKATMPRSAASEAPGSEMPSLPTREPIPCPGSKRPNVEMPPSAVQNQTAEPMAQRLCELAKDAFAGVTVPVIPDTSGVQAGGALISNTPIENPCSSLFELLYERQLYTAAHVFRVGLGRASTMLFDPFTAITLLAPSETAFAKINLTENSTPDATWKSLAEAHVLPGTITSRDVACSRRDGSFTLDAQTWNTRDITLHINMNATLTSISQAGGQGDCNCTAHVSKPDVPACLSVLHVLDRAMVT